MDLFLLVRSKITALILALLWIYTFSSHYNFAIALPVQIVGNGTKIVDFGNTNSDNAPLRFRPPLPTSNSNLNSNLLNNNVGVVRDRNDEATGIICSRPGVFVPAPDGCNRCYCDRSGQLTARCSRAYCPPGFPSGPLMRRNREK